MISQGAPSFSGRAAEYRSRENVEPNPSVQPEFGPGREWQKDVDEVVRAWQHGLKLMRERLTSWWRDPDVLVDDNGLAPDRQTIRRALELVHRLDRSVMDQARPHAVLLQLPLPRSAAVESDGSISLEFERGDRAYTYRIEPDAGVVLLVFDRDRLIRRHTIPV